MKTEFLNEDPKVDYYREWAQKWVEGTFLEYLDFNKWCFFWRRYEELGFTEAVTHLSHGARNKDWAYSGRMASDDFYLLSQMQVSQADAYLSARTEILETEEPYVLAMTPDTASGWPLDYHLKKLLPDTEWVNVGVNGPNKARGVETAMKFSFIPGSALLDPTLDPNQTSKWVSFLQFIICTNPAFSHDKGLATLHGIRRANVPLDFLLKGDELDEDTYHLYVHEVRDESPELGLDVFRSYIGITGRDWLLRFKEHQREAYKDSYYRVHKAMKTSPNINSTLLATGLSYREVNELEEKLVEEHSLFPKGLNMIPGGFAGARYLNSRGHKTRKKHTSESNPDFINKDVRECKARGERSVFDPPVWAYDDDLMSRIVLSRPDTFSKGDLANIRYLDNYLETLDYDFNQRREYISKEMKLVTDNEQRRLRSLLTGKTYSRIT